MIPICVDRILLQGGFIKYIQQQPHADFMSAWQDVQCIIREQIFGEVEDTIKYDLPLNLLHILGQSGIFGRESIIKAIKCYGTFVATILTAQY